MNTASIVSRVWSFCITLRGDGVCYGDSLEQLSYLIFLNMADEYSKPLYNHEVSIPEQYNWPVRLFVNSDNKNTDILRFVR